VQRRRAKQAGRPPEELHFEGLIGVVTDFYR
jgi:hypothetical protein